MKRSLSILFSFTVVLAALIGVYFVIQPAAQAAPPAAPQAGTTSVYPAQVPGDATFSGGALTAGTPFAMYATVSGLANSCNGPKFYYPATASSQGLTWNNGAWKDTFASWSSYGAIDGTSGSWTGWVVGAISNTAASSGSIIIGIKCGADANDYTTNVSVTKLDMTTTGGWIEGHARDASGNLLAGAPVIVRNSSNTIVGVYLTENNGVTEGYNSGDIGYYKVAVPTGSNYTAEVWDSNNVITGTAATGISVVAGATTPNVDINLPDATPPAVSSTVPTNNATGVNLYQPLSATFSENLNAATVTTTTFTLVDANGSVTGNVSYTAGTRTASFTPDSSLTPLRVYTATLTTGIQDLVGNPLAAPYTWSFTTGTADTTAPTIIARFPAPNAISVSLSSSIVITFSEDLKPSAVIPANFTLAGPSGSIGWSAFAYDATTDRLVLTPIALAVHAQHTVTINSGVTDWAGNPLAGPLSWSFGTEATPEMRAFHGDLHNHTSYSDGSLTPAQALAAGKAAGFDFMALTDHSYSIDDTEWANTLSAVDAATIDSQFVAIRGAEYTQGAEGHINVYNTVRHPCRTNTGATFCDYTPNLEVGVTVDGFYHWLAVTGTQALDGAGSLAQFNHPGWINFNDWKYHPEVSPTMRLEEVGNGNGSSYVFSEAEYIRSLDYGWKVGATNNADTHSPDWGTNTADRTGVWMAGLTKASLLDALRARLTFATEDKDYALYLKGNGVWMGSELPSTSSIAFEIYGNDPDGESGATVQLITFGGAIVTQTTVASSSFTWQPIVSVTPGVHYYYVKVTQPDGDRIVSSPIWTTGAQNISLTDLNAEPTIATIYNPSLFTARVTNRTANTQTVTVTFQVNGSIIAGGVITTLAPACSVGPCADGYASITWQPVVTGPVTITAGLSGVPAGDNPDDNSRALNMLVTDQKVPLVLIDDGHNNISSAPSDTRLFVNDLTAHGYNVLFNLDAITASDLNTETVKLLIINAYGPDQLTSDELQAIGAFVNAGGSLWLNGLADYAGKVAWAGTLSTRMNDLVASIETTAGYTIPVRFNSDEVLDGNDNNGYPWGVLWHNFPGADSTGVGMNVERIQSWSLNSFVDRNGTALTASDLGPDGFIAALGDEDAGTGTYGEANRTHNDDSDPTVPAFLYTAGNTVPGAVGYDIPGPAGRIFFYGDANDPYNIFSYTAGDGKQNELFNLETIMWLLGTPITKSTIAEARAYTVPNQPTNLNKLVWVEGKITAGFGEFFNTLYVQDETGGITIHAPAGDISATQYARGAYVRVLGTISTYQGDTEIQFFEAEQVQIITPTGSVPAPMPFSTHDAALEQNQGWLTQITGTVKSKGADYVMVDDGSGPVRAFLDGYNGTWDDVHVLDRVTVQGLISEDYNGPRIRVRNHGMHPLIPDDVAILATGLNFSGSTASVIPTTVKGGELLTYTLTISNSGASTGPFVLTDTLDAHVSLVSAPNMTVTGSVLTAQRDIAGQTTQTFAITVRANYGYSGTISNTAQLSGDGSTYNLNTAVVQVQGMYRVYLPVVRR